MLNSIIHIQITKPIKFAMDKLTDTFTKLTGGLDCNLTLTANAAIDEQCYSITRQRCDVYIEASSDSGFMYAMFYLERWIAHKGSLEGLADITASPQIKKRGIKINVPLDARTPSYSDSSDSAQLNIINMWDLSFWQEFIDRMALNNYNVLSLWTLSPFPSLVRIPEFPNTALDDVKRTTKYFHAQLEGMDMFTPDMYDRLVTIKKMTMDEKIDHWRKVMQYACERCVEVYLFTWNVFVFGTEFSGYDIDCDQDNPVTRDYYYYATKALLDTYPDLAGIGVTSGENMRMNDSDIEFTRATYGRAVMDYLGEHPERKFRFIHRMQYTRYDSIVDGFSDFACPFEISFKYSQAHMYSSTKPAFIDSFMKEKKRDLKIWLTVRNDDFYMYRWGDPDFAREYIKNMPKDHMTGFYMGADGFTWGRDYMDMRDMSHPLYIGKMWYMLAIWGWTSYYEKLPSGYFEDELNSHFDKDCSMLYKVWQSASGVIPIVNSTHWHDFDFQWYPEACCMYHKLPEDKIVFADIYEFMEGKSEPGSDYLSVKEYCELLIDGKQAKKKTPFDAAEDIFALSQHVLDNLAELKFEAMDSNELTFTVDDLEALAYLGMYYGLKIKAAMLLRMYKYDLDLKGKTQAVTLLKEAAQYWRKYSAKSKMMYKPQVLTRLLGYVDVARFDELCDLDVLLAQEL